MMTKEQEILVKVEGLSKKFCKNLKTSLWYGVKDLMTGVRGTKQAIQLRPKEFWAVKDVNFELRRGECLGLIGHNGAGKSTLLKILNGLINPDDGKVTIKGRVGALIELGAGFNPILSGRENIYNNGAILGFSRSEIDDKLQEIIAFAELEEFIDMPVQHYSSGMKVRLGFAIAAQMEPDVLIIDEVLAVGDLGFVLKCFKTIDTLLPHTAVIFVSHSMPMVSRICNQIILMDHGKVKFQGSDVSKAIDLYYQGFVNNESNVVFDEGIVKIENVYFKNLDANENGIVQINWRDDILIVFELDLMEDAHLLFNITIFDKEQRPIAVFKNNEEEEIGLVKKGKLMFELLHKKHQLSKGTYSLNMAVYNRDTGKPLLRANGLISFQVLYEDDVWQPFMLEALYNKIEN